MLDLATRKHRVLFRGIFARYARSGHLVYVTSDGTLMAVRRSTRIGCSSPATRRAGRGCGRPHRRRRGGPGHVTATGTLWYAAGGVASAGTLEVVWVGRDGSATPRAGMVDRPARRSGTVARRTAAWRSSVRDLLSQHLGSRSSTRDRCRSFTGGDQQQPSAGLVGGWPVGSVPLERTRGEPRRLPAARGWEPAGDAVAGRQRGRLRR